MLTFLLLLCLMKVATKRKLLLLQLLHQRMQSRRALTVRRRCAQSMCSHVSRAQWDVQVGTINALILMSWYWEKVVIACDNLNPNQSYETTGKVLLQILKSVCSGALFLFVLTSVAMGVKNQPYSVLWIIPPIKLGHAALRLKAGKVNPKHTSCVSILHCSIVICVHEKWREKMSKNIIQCVCVHSCMSCIGGWEKTCSIQNTLTQRFLEQWWK